MMNNEYYQGPEALRDYLRPSRNKMVPLVELPEALNPYLNEYDIHIDAKLMSTLPLGNVKSLPAWQMLEDGNVSGVSLVEASSGNTALSLGLLAPHFGASGVTAIASPDVSEGKLALLRLTGVAVTLVKGPICPDPNDPDGAIARARKVGATPGKKNLGQYDNMANPAIHERITGPQLVEQLGDSIGLFCAGMGTTGTLLGTASFLGRRVHDIRIGGVVRTPNNPVPGVRTVTGLSEVSFDWGGVLNEPLVEVGEKESYTASLRLIRHGLLVGPSAGFAYAGLLKHLERLVQNGGIESLRGKHAVFICPDLPFPYAADYERILDKDQFPAVQNEHLRAKAMQSVATIVPEIDANDVTGKVLVDVRELEEYRDHHIEQSVHVPLAELPAWLKQQNNDTREVVFICRTGNRSARATHLARQMGVNAYNMTGGMIEWSARGFAPGY
jgi:cysteine synthase/rhodanese-related sulfurtransferase